MGVLRPDPMAGRRWRPKTLLLGFLVPCLWACSVNCLEFSSNVYNATISENSVGKTYVNPSEKMGIYISDPSLLVRYKIISGDPKKMFKAESRTVGDFCFLLLRTRTEEQVVLNREYQDYFKLIVRSTITSHYRKSVKLKAQAEIHVHILDTNDLNPFFYPTEYKATIPEDTPLHRSILQVTASDPDVGINGEVYYRLREPSLQFAVHPTRGVLTLTRPLDYQKESTHRFSVLAEDRGPKFRAADVRFSTATVQVNVAPVNLHSPEINVRQLASILEHSDPDVYAIVRVTDRDKGVHGMIGSLEIVDGDSEGYFNVVAARKQNEYRIELNGDRDLAPGDYSLTLRATDKGSPPRSTAQKVYMLVPEVTQPLPVFSHSDYDVEVEEVSPVGFPLVRVIAEAADKVLQYSVESGNDEAMFEIHPFTGVLKTVKTLDREARAYYSLTVSAVDKNVRAGARKGTAIVNIRVLDNNDNDPMFNTTSITVVFDENKPQGSVVCTVHATDRDDGDNGYVTYNLANLIPLPFSVDHFTGEIKTTEVLDYETMRREYHLKVRASDWGSPYRRQAEMTVRVRVRDVNDHRPLFERVDCKGHISDATTLNTEILTLSALDFDSGSIVNYLMVPSNDDSCFRLDSVTGVLRLTCNLKKETVKEWILNVSATDGQHFADVMAVTITTVKSGENKPVSMDRLVVIECKEVGVIDRLKEQMHLGKIRNKAVNTSEPSPTRYGDNRHTPEFLTNVQQEVWVNESVTIGSEVVAIRARDRDHGYSGLLVYIITNGNDDGCFKLDLYTGRLLVDCVLDRETTAKYMLNLTAFDLGRPQKSASRSLVVNLRDVNDNAPTFEKSSHQFLISESVPNGTSIVRLRASDPDEGQNSQLSFKLETYTDKFRVDSQSGLLTVISSLDRETLETYNLRIWVKDSCPYHPLSSSTTVNIRLEDVNDNPPLFSLSQFWVKVREDLPAGALVMVMSAKDPDTGDGGKVIYELSGGNGIFEIDPLMGVVRLAQELDFEQKQLYNLTVSAHDQGNPPLSSTAFLLVEVEDVNENFRSPKFMDMVASGTVSENQPEGTFVMKVIAVDADPPGLDSTVTYSIRDGDGVGIFSIDDQGNIRTRAVLDRETSLRYWLTVIAQDRGAVPLTSRVDVYIEVLDENDNTPLTPEPAYYPNIQENSPPNTTVIKLDAFDLDANPNQRISFHITAGDPQSNFHIDPLTGFINTTSRILDREDQSEHVLEVTVSDNNEPPLTSTTRIVVKVLDVNDHEPAFFQRMHRCKVLEIEKQGPTHCQVLATDGDSGPNGDITYSLGTSPYSSVFRIHPKTGSIYSHGPLAGGQQFELLVTATDGGKPPLSSNTRVIMEILSRPNTASRAPTMKTMESQIVVSETDPVGHLVALLQGEDPDGDRLWYSITSGNIGDMFTIQSDGGALLLARKLKWEVNSYYNLTIGITDGVNTIFTSLYIKVMSINNYMPEFLEHTYTVDISENSPVDTKILKLEAVDRDQDKRLFYTIHNCASPLSIPKFRLDSTSGVLSITHPLDHETAQRHILTIAVTDSGTPSKRCFTRVEVNVHDHNDHPPEFLTTMFEGQVFETAALGTSVVQIIAIDRDKGKNAQLVYSIVSGNVGSAFSINPILGIVQVAQHLDRHSMAEYFLKVRATDQGEPPLNNSVTVHIVVTVADNAPPRFDKIEYAVELFENGRSGIKVVAVSATSRSSVYYEIVAGNTGGCFTINPTSGVIHTTRSLDYEISKFYNLTVHATNMVGTSASATVLVHVLDRNDNHPYFLQTEVYGIVSEAADIDSIVFDNSSMPLVVTAADEDSELNAVLFYKIVESGASQYFKIDSSTGAISTAQVLDHEKFSNLTFSVQVMDMGKPRLSALIPAAVSIQISDVNDCPPRFQYSSYTAVLLLPTYHGVIVTTVKAMDPDTVATTLLKYNIVSGNYGDKFAIQEDTGLITVRNAEDLREEYQLVVSASDSEFEASAKVAIKIKESQTTSLRFSKEKYEATVSENSPVITTAAVVNVIGTGLNENLVFKILNPSDMFEIGGTSGVIRTTGESFDRELMNLYTLVVQVKRETFVPPEIANVLVEVTVLDVNDNSPIFVNLPYYSVVPMEAEKGYVVRKVHAIDLDMGVNGYIHYELQIGDNKTFHINSKTGEIILLKPVGLQSIDYKLIVAAFDGGNPPLWSTVEVPIRVINRDMPVFPKQYYNVSVAESLSPNSAVLTVLADSPEGRQLIYSIVDGNHQEDFSVDFNTDPVHNNGPCVIHVVEALDYENIQQYQLTLRATDSVSGAYANVLVNVNIEDVNDNAPLFEQSSYVTSVSEASPFGASILQVKATDKDSANNQRIQYYIIGNATSYFHVESSEGIVFIKQPLDHEQDDSHHFVIMATDGGSPSLTSTASVWVNVLDMNDNPPKFEHQVYNCAISEGAKRGQFVTRVTASDLDISDRSKLIYSIVGGNELQTFAIDTSSGVVTLSNLHQFSNQSVYSLNISVTDGVYSSYAQILVNILGNNNHSPVFTRTVYEVTVQENLSPGVLVTTVKAIDADRDEYGKLTYSIESQVHEKLFLIDPETGSLYTRVSFDREKCSLHEVPVAAFDGGGRPGYSTVRISITNDNDNAPLFSVAEYRAYVHENTSMGTTILQVHSVDDDDDINSASVEYSVYSSNTSTISEMFGVSKDLGEVYLKKSAFKFANQAFQFFIRARDKGIPSQENEVPVNVIIVPSNFIVPKFEQRRYEFFLSEKSVIGTVVSTLNVSSPEPIKYGFVAAPIDSSIELYQSMFSISDQGKIVLNSALDRETTSIFQLSVKAETSINPPLVAYCDIIINVMDENDNHPIFESNPYVVSLAENIEKGSSILKVVATDADVGLNADIHYSFGPDVGNVANVFRLDSKSGWITTLSSLDYETVSWYNFTVMGHDKGHPQLFTTTTVIIRIQDYNDNPPKFEQTHYDVAIYEDSLPGTVIVTLEIEDADFEPSRNEFYITSGNPHDQFQVRQTGEIFVNKPLDRETTVSYLLEVTVTDGLFVSKSQVAIEVLDVNDNPPICSKSKYTEWVSEALPLYSYILTVKATDADDRRNSLLLFSLSGVGSDDLLIDSATGVIKTVKSLDREQQSRYLLVAHVQDRGHPEWECTSTVEVLLNDVNDNAPVFLEPKSVSVSEDVVVGTLISKVHATDKDLGSSRKISYSFIESGRGQFAIDENTGIIRLKKPLDRETEPAYNLTVQASDHGVPQLSSIALLSVTVLDVNDNPPEFTNKILHASVSESALIGTTVITVLATSQDIGINAQVTYSLPGGNEQNVFEIDPKTGIVTVGKLLDYETVREYFLTVQAIDGGIPPLSSQAIINVTVTDANDNAPTFSQPTYRAIVREDAAVGTRVIQVLASDADSTPNAHLAFIIIGGDTNGHFLIDSTTGYISVAAPLDRETVASYVLQLQCIDSGSPQLSSTALINIEVSDVNDNAPLFSHSNYTAIIQEGKPIGYTVLKFVITDADVAPNTGPFNLAIVSGNSENAFRLVQQDATVRTAIKFEHEKRNQYHLQIQVTDNGSPALTSEVWVTALVIEESQFPPIISPLDVMINSFLDDFPGGVMGRLHATDKDPYDKFHYSIVAPFSDLFSIDQEDGTLVAHPGLDVGSYSINVSVTDGKFTSYGTVSVEVNLVTEEAVKNSINVQVDDITPEDFILTHRRNFLQGLRAVLNVRMKDIDILSVQPTGLAKGKNKRSTNQDLDVLFAIRKAPHVFYPPKHISVKLKEKQTLLESTSGLKIVKIIKDRCTSDRCVHGDCADRITFDDTYVVSITTESLSYVCPQHIRKLECLCEPGYGGFHCEIVINECARKPCSTHHVCFPDPSDLGYICQCPPGKTGPMCDRDKAKTCQDGTSCYEEKNPISYNGRSYARYTLTNPIERHLSIAVNVRTVQSTGNLMYAAGIRDYSILEIVNGYVQYRFDCGSGEGLVRVELPKVNDGAWHDVCVERRGNAAEVIVDKQYRVSGNAPGVHDILNLDGNDIYFGAEVRHHPVSFGYEDIRMGFVGCMDDIRIDSVSLPLHATGGNSVVTLRRFANVEFQCGVLFDPGICGSQPCANGGSCRAVGNAFTCQCLPRFLGSRCEIDTNPCASSPCLNGGTCHNVNNSFHCDCSEGLSGKRCGYGRYCNPNPCHNGGACEEGTYNPLCKCHGFYGELCQYDFNECQANPCFNGATCHNVDGSFHCQCPANVTGALCTETLFTNSITSTTWNTTIEEIIGITLVILFIMLLAITLACCWRIRNKRRQRHPNHQMDDDPAANELMLKNPISEKENVNRLSKISNLEAAFTTPPLPPRPASYTPSTQESLSVYNKFDTVRSYGSAADDLENVPRYGSDLFQNLNKGRQVSVTPSLPPPPPSSSGSDSLLKAGWEADLNSSKEKVYEDKIQNNLNPGTPDSTVKSIKCQKVPTVAISSVPSLSSADDSSVMAVYEEGSALQSTPPPPPRDASVREKGDGEVKEKNIPGYHWDVSDWATSQKAISNFSDVSQKEIQDSSSVQSADSNSFVSQIELLPSAQVNAFQRTDQNIKCKEVSVSKLIADPLDSIPCDILEYQDDDILSSHAHKYQLHPNTYLPPPCFINTGGQPWLDFPDDDVNTYGFPSHGGRGFRLALESGDYGDVNRNSVPVSASLSIDGMNSGHASVSDISMKVCDLDDSEANMSDGDVKPQTNCSVTPTYV